MKFKIGDKVKVIKIEEENIDASLTKYLNKEGEIINIISGDSECPYDVGFNDNDWSPMKECELELII